MWVFMSDAFLSIVADSTDPKSHRLLVRARRQGDIERVFPEAKVTVGGGTDYGFRAWVLRGDVANAMSQEVSAIDYDNFKDSITDDGYHQAATNVWLQMVKYQSATYSPSKKKSAKSKTQHR